MNIYMQNRLSWGTLTYWNALAQFTFYALAVAYLLVHLGSRGFRNSTRVSVT